MTGAIWREEGGSRFRIWEAEVGYRADDEERTNGREEG